jgi:hypothetical protein
MIEEEIQKNRKYLEAIEKDNPQIIHFNKQLVSDSVEMMIVDYKFDEDIVIRRTLGKRSYYENRENFPNGYFGEPVLEKIEFLEPQELKGQLLKVPIYLNS